MKIKSYLITLLFSLLCLVSCSTNVGDMIDSYNTHFTEDTSERDKIVNAPVPGDDGFEQSTMLEDEYYIWNDATLNLSAPENCSQYQWTITDPDEKDPDNIDYYKIVPVHHFGTDTSRYEEVWTEKTFYINIPDSGLSTNKVYILTLEVEGGEEKKYTDSAILVIYEHITI